MKLTKKIIVLLLVVALSISVFACSDAPTFKVSGKQDTSYAVTSQGGSAVQYGNYVYLINGYRGFDDEDGKQNKNVQKGGIYRAELEGKSYTTTIDGKSVKMFEGEMNSDTELVLVSQKGVDLDEKEIDEVKVQQIAGKTVGTDGYADGGLFIFGSYVYYATPSNELDRYGERETTKTEFYRSKLDGSLTERIYKSDKETNASPYAFYHYNGKVYLVVLDGTDLVSVASTNDRISKGYKIAENVTSAILPYKDMYFDGISTQNIEDFIFFTRAFTNDDPVRSGNVVEMMRPDGTNRNNILMNGNEITLEAVRDGLLFYKDTQGTFTNIFYTDCAAVVSPSTFVAGRQVEGVAINGVTDYTNYYVFRPNQFSNTAFALGIMGSIIYFFDGMSATPIYEGTSTEILFAHDGFVYFLEGGAIHRTQYNVDMANKTQKSQQLTEKTVNNVGQGIEICASHLVYFADIDEHAANYTFFKQLTLNPNHKEIFVGFRIDADIPEDDEDEE